MCGEHRRKDGGVGGDEQDVAVDAPDGIKVDAQGRVYVSAFDGVHVFDPEGHLLGKIRLPGAVNFAFGGVDRNILFITADSAVFAAVLTAQGA